MQETKTLDMLDAAECGDTVRAAALLAEAPELVNAAGEYNKTPLHWAAENDDIELARMLLDAGANHDQVTTWGASPLEWAAIMGSTGVADLLLAHGADGMNLVLAAGLGKLAAVQQFCENNDTLDDLGIPQRPNDLNDPKGWPQDSAHMKGDVLGEAFQLACRNGHVAVAEYLLNRGADIDARGYFGGTGLHWAAINGHQDMVVFLLDHGADLNLEDRGFHAKPAGWAVEGGHDELANLIKNRSGGLQIEH